MKPAQEQTIKAIKWAGETTGRSKTGIFAKFFEISAMRTAITAPIECQSRGQCEMPDLYRGFSTSSLVFHLLAVSGNADSNSIHTGIK